MADDSITAARVRELLHYDPLTGVFTRKMRTAQRHQVGDRADFVIGGKALVAGYRKVALDSKSYLAHRIAWLYVHGRLPEQQIDHINGDPGDNRISNLREASDRMNKENARKPRANNKIGFLGVCKPYPGSSKWVARIQTRGKGRHIGCFDTPEEAHDAYVQAKRVIHAGCTI